MIYLVLPTLPPQIAACEDEAHAARLEAAGWERIDEAAYMQAWREKDAAALRVMYPERERVVGEKRFWWY